MNSEQENNTKIMASFRLFNRDLPMEFDFYSDQEPDVDQAKRLVMDKLHEAKGPDGGTLKYDEDYDDGTPKPVDRFDIFNTIQFLEIIIEYRKKMIKYSWKRATIKNSRTKMVECTEHGAFVMTKTIM